MKINKKCLIFSIVIIFGFLGNMLNAETEKTPSQYIESVKLLRQEIKKFEPNSITAAEYIRLNNDANRLFGAVLNSAKDQRFILAPLLPELVTAVNSAIQELETLRTQANMQQDSFGSNAEEFKKFISINWDRILRWRDMSDSMRNTIRNI